MRPVCWVERDEDGVKREIRVRFVGTRTLEWRSKRTDEPRWNTGYAPTAADWACLTAKTEDRYRRRAASFKILEMVRSHRPDTEKRP